MIPIDIINKILVYVSEINNDMIITQYDPYTNKVYYKINFYSDLLWKIKSNLMMKKIYPIYSCDFNNKYTKELYKNGIEHYERLLRNMKITNLNY